MFMLNLLVLVLVFSAGMYATAWGIARLIMELSEADIIAKIREIKKEAGLE